MLSSFSWNSEWSIFFPIWGRGPYSLGTSLEGLKLYVFVKIRNNFNHFFFFFIHSKQSGKSPTETTQCLQHVLWWVCLPCLYFAIRQRKQLPFPDPTTEYQKATRPKQFAGWSKGFTGIPASLSHPTDTTHWFPQGPYTGGWEKVQRSERERAREWVSDWVSELDRKRGRGGIPQLWCVAIANLVYVIWSLHKARGSGLMWVALLEG